MPEHATPDATQALAAAHPELAYNALGNMGLMVSAAGFGCYRVDARVEEHHAALEKALLAGVNLIDTSTNYTDGQSELLVGQVLGRLTGAGAISREQVVVVSKAGYIQGQNYEASQARKEEGRPWPELVELGQGLEHCLHPEFLADQLSTSLERLGLSRLDVLLLHNPEYFLGWAASQGVELGQAREEYFRRLRQAFLHLEDEVERGRIGCYGISSNTFPHASDHPEFTSLARVWLVAQGLGAGHHFRVVEFPCNLLETGAVTRANQPGGQGLLEQARQLRLGVLVNRPLNALDGGRLVRLAEVEAGLAPTPQEVQKAIADLQASEDQLKTRLLPNLEMETAQLGRLGDFLSAATVLEEHWNEFQGLEHWRSVEGEYFLPRIQAALQFIMDTLGDTPELRGVVENHLRRMGAAFGAVGGVYLAATAGEMARLKERIASLDPEWAQAPLLSQMALRAPRSTEGVSSVLVGMRRPAYVADVLEELSRPVEQAPRQEAWRGLAQAE